MGDVVPFRKRSPKETARGKTLCQRGFHKWQIENARPFDVKLGRLVTKYRCRRCGATRTTAD
jgi:hypothetical protein